MKAYTLYLLRWQASTPLLWVIIYWLGTSIWATIVANLIGGAIFFFVDKWIFAPKETGIIAGLTLEQERNHPCYDEKEERII